MDSLLLLLQIMEQHQFGLMKGQNGSVKVSCVVSHSLMFMFSIFGIKTEYIILHYHAISRYTDCKRNGIVYIYICRFHVICVDTENILQL